MCNRIYVEKKAPYEWEGEACLKTINNVLGIHSLEKVRVIQIYDVKNLSPKLLDKGISQVFSDPFLDDVWLEDSFPDAFSLVLTPLPEQFCQRADSAVQILKLLGAADEVEVNWSIGYIFEGQITVDEKERIKKYLLNPLEMAVKFLEEPSFCPEMKTVSKIPIYDEFTTWSRDRLKEFHQSMKLSLSQEDLVFIQKYFRKLGRGPTETEILVLDTYWSDHCRHTTFETPLTDIVFKDPFNNEAMEDVYEVYTSMRREMKQEDKPVTLMDMATIVGRYFLRTGQLDDLEKSSEINACSLHIEVDVNGKKEPWLLMFKNETHNHPTEIEPFGGAATCLGGAIRDPLSGRSYVFQGMRISGCSHLGESIEEVPKGKLPQISIGEGSSKGFSSYGNQIGLSTTFVKEIYHPGYRAKHLEVGAVVGAVPEKYVLREEPKPGDIVLLIGGLTGRDGIGGATGSSKSHDEDSLYLCGGEVQKGNPPEERKIQRLFRNTECTLLIKKANDCGAGGISVAIGELSESIQIDLDQIPLKDVALNGTEIALSESQERMAVVINPKDQKKFEELAKRENLSVSHVATVTDNGILEMRWRGKSIVEIDGVFLKTHGVKKSAKAIVERRESENLLQKKGQFTFGNLKGLLSSLNIAGQQGLGQQFDSTVGRSTVLLPYGGKYQKTPAEASVQKIPVLEGETDTVSFLSYGFHPYLCQWSPFLGAQYAMVESISRLVAAGASWQKTRFSFQEYFPKVGRDSKKWGWVTAALLGSIKGQLALGLPAIGGKDSMSGSYEALDVPPTFIAFGVTPGTVDSVLSPEFKAANHYVYYLKTPKLDGNIDYDYLKKQFERIRTYNQKGLIKSLISLKEGGLLEGLALMTFGNGIGFEGNDYLSETYDCFDYGSFLMVTEVPIEGEQLIGKTGGGKIKIGEIDCEIEEALRIYEKTHKAYYPMELKSNKEFNVLKGKVCFPKKYKGKTKFSSA